MTRVLRIVVLAACAIAFSATAPAFGLGLSVSGNHLVNESGQSTRLLALRRHARG
jgi:hypothetical protein